MTNIKDSIEKLVDQIVIEDAANPGNSATAQRSQDLALKAILVGQGTAPNAITQEWRDFMAFLLSKSDASSDPNNLARLLPEDGTHTDANMQKERAYLLGNGMCGTTTTRALLEADVNGRQLTTNMDQ